jgi:hypothetical protein
MKSSALACSRSVGWAAAMTTELSMTMRMGEFDDVPQGIRHFRGVMKSAPRATAMLHPSPRSAARPSARRRRRLGKKAEGE